MKNKYSCFLVIVAIFVAGCAKEPIISNTGTFMDSRDQHIYKYVRIGTQTWMAENLAWLPAISSALDGSEKEPRYYVYDYGFEAVSVWEAKAQPNYSTYGVLYNWVGAKTACPTGWHLPTDDDWAEMEANLGAHAGKKMKSITEWPKYENGDNSSNFNARPGGCRHGNGGFIYVGYDAVFWSSTEDGTSTTWSRLLVNYFDGVYRFNGLIRSGFSVRCVRD